MSSLYRCKSRVAYRPFRSNRLIVFEENQVQDLDVTLKWQPNLAVSSADRGTPASAFTNSLSQSKCSVTITDPYLTGLAWPALYDAASLYTASNIAASNNILLPACVGNQTPESGKCFRFEDFVGDTSQSGTSGAPAEGQAGSVLDNYAYLLVSLWYDVKGSSFGTDFYFRVSGISISHGSAYPSVTIRGVEARSVLFNQSLANIGLNENVPIDAALAELTKSLGYEAQFCANTNAPQATTDEKRLPRSMRLRGVTHAEAISRLINSTGGNMLSLPTREYANKISLCSRAEINQGCSVFYLGKGLYESYEIDGQPEFSLLAKNAENGLSINDRDPYTAEIPQATRYTIEDIFPKERAAAMAPVRKVPFPDQFSPCAPKCFGKDFNGFVWRGAGPGVAMEELKNHSLRGIAPNGETAISFLSGDVKEASSADHGRVTIQTDFWLRVKSANPKGKEQVFKTRVFQESTNLVGIRVQAGQKVSISEVIGASSPDKPEFTRFYVRGAGGAFITIAPELVWKYALPPIVIPPTQSTQVGTTGAAPAPQTPVPPGKTSPSGICLKAGSTGSSSGPHLDIRADSKGNANNAGVVEESLKIIQRLQAQGTEYIQLPNNGSVDVTKVTDPNELRRLLRAEQVAHGRRARGGAIDISVPQGTNLCLGTDQRVSEVLTTKCVGQNNRRGDCGGGLGNAVVVSTPNGAMIYGHLAPGGIPSGVVGQAGTGGTIEGKGAAGNTRMGLPAAPGLNGLTVKTAFKGVPKALRIIPGRTVLSFVTNYDAWIEGGRDVAGPDPGVWITERFKNWMISECSFKWAFGDLRVELSAVSAWGNQVFNVPTLQGFMGTGGGNYYDYIRSLGPLSWTLEDGRSSTEVLCPEAQSLTSQLVGTEGVGDGNQTTAAGRVSSTYPTSGCEYTGTRFPKDRVNAIMAAARAGGITSKAGLAGVVGNAAAESFDRLDPAALNSSSGAFGIFQWLGGRRAGLERFAQSKGKSRSDFDTQMGWFVQELKGADFRGRDTVASLNSQSDPTRAAAEFNRLFERAPGQKEAERQQNAREVFNNLKCAKP